jgi:hypothetical protein
MNAFLCHRFEPGVELLLGKLRIAHGTALPADPERFAIIHWGHSSSPAAHSEALNPPEMVSRASRPSEWKPLLQLGGQLTEPAEMRRNFGSGQPVEADGDGELLPAAGIGAGQDSSHRTARSAHRRGGAARMRDDLAHTRDNPEYHDHPEYRGRSAYRDHPAYTREYVVPVFHLQALTVFERAAGPLISSHLKPGFAGRFRELDPAFRSHYADKARREAVRAIYTLGLDFGTVSLGVLPDGRLVVRSVNPSPRLNERLADLFAEAIHRFDEELERECRERRRDTEILLGTDPEFLLCTHDGQVVFASNFLQRSGEVGCDSIVLPDRRRLFPLAELRPAPAVEPEQLVRNLRLSLRKAARLIRDDGLAWVAGGMPVRGFPLGGHIHLSGVRLSARLLRVLDNYLSLPLVLLEDESTRERRPNYGFLGDFRRKPHGGFEYRTPPSWLVSPFIAAGVLALTRLLAEHYRELKQFPLQSAEIQKLYYSGDKRQLLPVVRKLWEELEPLPAYARYAHILDRFKERLFRLQGWNEREDFRASWKLEPSAKTFSEQGLKRAAGPDMGTGTIITNETDSSSGTNVSAGTNVSTDEAETQRENGTQGATGSYGENETQGATGSYGENRTQGATGSYAATGIYVATGTGAIVTQGAIVRTGAAVRKKSTVRKVQP